MARFYRFYRVYRLDPATVRIVSGYDLEAGSEARAMALARQMLSPGTVAEVWLRDRKVGTAQAPRQYRRLAAWPRANGLLADG